MESRARKTYYLLAQLGGWTLYSAMLGLWNYLEVGLSMMVVWRFFFIIIALGIGLSHLYRLLVISRRWLDMKLEATIPRIIAGSILFGIIHSLLLESIQSLFFGQATQRSPVELSDIMTLFITWSIIYLLWSAIYFAYHYLRNYEREEIKNLRLLSSQREVELASLKAQLNPHFIFNAMNSIRALVDEDPKLAKSAVTKLSNILRNSLMQERSNLVTIAEELELVRDHLDLEQIRYEERLQLHYDIDTQLQEVKIPPMMIQTLVENAIKHGIARRQAGGMLRIIIRSLSTSELEILVQNSGQLNSDSSGTGIGLANLQRRLSLLYGKESSYQIINSGPDSVTSRITLPKKNDHENNRNR